MSEHEVSRAEGWAARLSGLPRFARMLLSALVALIVTAFTAQLLTTVMGAAALTEQGAATVAYGISGGAGLLSYIAGWWTLLGFGDDPQAPVRQRGVYFLLFGLVVLVALVVWVLFGTVLALLPPEVPI